MITCPWCDTNYTTFQQNCKNCGGPLPLPTEKPTEKPLKLASEPLLTPPPVPRDIPKNFARRVLLADGWSIAASVFLLLGGIFSMVGCGLTAGIVTAFVGIPFLILGLGFFSGGGLALRNRYQTVQKTMTVLRQGEAVLGEIEDVQEVLHVRVNGRHPWQITYRFQLNGQWYQNSLSTLRLPKARQQPGVAVYVLYLFEDPEQNTLYPHLF